MDIRIIAFVGIAFSALFSSVFSPSADASADPPVPITASVNDGQCDEQAQVDVSDLVICSERR